MAKGYVVLRAFTDVEGIIGFEPGRRFLMNEIIFAYLPEQEEFINDYCVADGLVEPFDSDDGPDQSWEQWWAVI